jgi:deaminated glutathione amidase
MKAAAIQMVSSPTLQTNLDSALALLKQAALEGAELAVLPEYFCLLGHSDTDKLGIQEVYGKGAIQQFLSDAARALDLWIVGGTLPLSVDQAKVEGGAQAGGLEALQGGHGGGRVFNSSLVFSPAGNCAARYDKIHLFKFDNGQERYDESRVLQAGHRPVTFELPSRDGHVWRIGMSVCYDLRFPELYRGYAQSGVDMLLVPSAFTHTTGRAHWEVLLRARAIENQAFVVAAAQGGLHGNGRRTWGHSMLVDPWGMVVAQMPQGAGVVCQDLLPAVLMDSRNKLPALAHRVL